MKLAPLPENEAARIRVLERYDVLDTPREEVFDRITRIASLVTGAPISLVSLVDDERQWFKSRVGLEASQTPRGISFCGHALESNVPLVIPDASKDERFADNPLVIGGLGIRLYVGIPLKVSENVTLGTLCVIDQQAHELDEDQVTALKDLASMVVRELELRKVALTDPLTGAFNRRMFEKLGAKEMSRANRQGQPFCFAMLDLDRFKQVNDDLGHDVGDAVLMHVAQLCQETLRTEDSLFRLGGEEFGIILGNTDIDAATEVMEWLRRKVAAAMTTVRDETVSVTLSAGISVSDPADKTIDEIVRRADVALYQAKGIGRNFVKVYQ